ncbi:diaminopimelate epimerase [Steroidobacter gossypii]|uniref:diaminopimelate epimerase n=1 Tax=Steroidobacter gossypii TaxID=2805490 RepID=UPI002AC35D13|nr:diaminopimelate epimerase [Steroidobacter gossypii]
MRLSFTKMHGLGNDFIVFDAPAGAELPSAEAFRRLADRRTGIGFDQALVLMPPSRADFDVFYRIFNADGSEVEQCGNGARCIASLVARRIGKARVRMDSPGGEVNGLLGDDGLVSVDMGVPNFAPESLPFDANREADVYPLRVDEKELQIGTVSMGNPHAVMQVPSVREAAVDTLGPAVENHPRFAKRTNVGFMEVVSPTHIRLRVFERGVGETQACGTGACAAVAVGRRWGLLQEQVQVDAPGGRMVVRWPGPDQALWLTGPAVTVFEGTVEL